MQTQSMSPLLGKKGLNNIVPLYKPKKQPSVKSNGNPLPTMRGGNGGKK